MEPVSSRDFRLDIIFGQPPETASIIHFSSYHTGVVQFAMCDGAVRVIRLDANFTYYAYASGWKDGVVVDWTQVE